MNADNLLEQLNILNESYVWIIKESEKLLVLINKAWDIDDMEAIEKYRNKFLELENRHNADKKTYNALIRQSREYFIKKYNIDLLKIFELEDL